MNKFTGRDFAIGVCVWVGCTLFAATETECVKLNTCRAGDMFLFGVIAVGMLGTAYVAMLIFSGVFRGKK
jgi:hypothetical protein